MIWNFAYGSNMHAGRLRDRAGIEPARSEPAVLHEWRLAFNLATGLSFVEPAMANIVEARGEAVHGVALQMTEAELDALVASEGGDRFYRRVEVTVQSYAGEAITALAFVAHEEVVCDEVAPSLRYLNLLREGARRHGLDEAYCAALDAHPAAPVTRLSKGVRHLFAALEHPRARRVREAMMWTFQQIARVQSGPRR